jgi:hypothetical protein
MLLDRPVTTLDSVLSEAWGALLHGEPAECPICHGEMHPRLTASSSVAGGRCADCGTTLD